MSLPLGSLPWLQPGLSTLVRPTHPPCSHRGVLYHSTIIVCPQMDWIFSRVGAMSYSLVDLQHVAQGLASQRCAEYIINLFCWRFVSHVEIRAIFIPKTEAELEPEGSKRQGRGIPNRGNHVGWAWDKFQNSLHRAVGGKRSLESQMVEAIGVSMQILGRGWWEQAPALLSPGMPYYLQSCLAAVLRHAYAIISITNVQGMI